MKSNGLKYRFVAHYLDGKSYFQNEHDVSMRDPKKSCFHDVDQNRLEFFELVSEVGRSVGVSVMDGHFEVDGLQFRLHDGDGLSNYRLLFDRHHTAMFDSEMNEKRHEVVYRVGWTAETKDGTVVTRTMEVD